MLRQLKSCCLVFSLCCCALVAQGCSHSQTVKDAWKGTRNFWYEYANVPASIDYEQTGDIEKGYRLLAQRMIIVDERLSDLERTMSNADKPPTQAWLVDFTKRFPWLTGFAGVRADGQVIGQQPPTPLKPVDYPALLKEDPKAPRALRGQVQNTPMGPEVFLATPLFDGDKPLGVVVCNFDMRGLVRLAPEPDELLIFTPDTILHSGKYDFSATPLASVNWAKTITSDSYGYVGNANAGFAWMVRYFADQPMIFATHVAGDFPLGQGFVGQFHKTEPAKQAAPEQEAAHASPEQPSQPEAEEGYSPDPFRYTR